MNITDIITPVFNHINMGILLIDPDDNIRAWNNFLSKCSGLRADEVIGRNIYEVFPYLSRQWMELKLKSVRLIKNYSFISWKQKHYLLKFDRQDSIITDEFTDYMYQDCTFIPLIDERSGVVNVCITIQDMTDIAVYERKLEELNEVNKELEQITNFDPLTSTYNKEYIEKQIDYEFKKSKRYKNKFTIVLLSIDGLKDLNNTYGRIIGDSVIKNVALYIRSLLRDSDLIGRMGGGEFCLLIPETDCEKAIVLCSRLSEAVRELSVSLDNFSLNVTISMGVACFKQDINDYLQLLHEADIALHNSQQNKKNAISLYTTEGCKVYNH